MIYTTVGVVLIAFVVFASFVVSALKRARRSGVTVISPGDSGWWSPEVSPEKWGEKADGWSIMGFRNKSEWLAYREEQDKEATP